MKLIIIIRTLLHKAIQARKQVKIYIASKIKDIYTDIKEYFSKTHKIHLYNKIYL